MIALKNVSKSYDGKKVIDGLSLQINPGSSLCIEGDSGSGKTTLLRLLIRADDPDGGTIDVDGVNLRSLPAPVLQLYRRRVGIIFQESILLDHLTAAENLSLPLALPGASDILIQRNTEDLLQRVGLQWKANAFPKNLSHSERALLCIARALITAPMVVLADEPLRTLDATQAKSVLELLSNMQKKGTTVVIFSRDAGIARALHAQTLHLKDGAIAKQTETDVATSASKDAHRILEEEAAPADAMATESVDEPDTQIDDATNVPVSEKPHRTGKRIRITSIGSNS